MSAARVSERRLKFSATALKGHEWKVYDIDGEVPGPLLCVMAGMHVNEVAAIAAARQLIAHFAATPFRGRVSILPIVDPAAIAGRAQHLSPVDGKNINFCFPGDASGSYSEALADALLREWAGPADILIDLHGGDLCERVTPFCVVQLSGNHALDAVNTALAEAFDPAVIVQLPPAALTRPGRSCSGRVALGRRAVFAEAGGNGLPDQASLRHLRDGVLRVAAYLGMLTQAPPGHGAAAPLAEAYHWIAAEADGWCDYQVEAGARVRRGELLAQISDLAGRSLHRLTAPADGIVLWRCTHPLVCASHALFGIGACAKAAR